MPLSKHPPKFAVGDHAVVTSGGLRGYIVKVIEVQDGWPYCKYRVLDHDHKPAQLDERDLGKTNVTGTKSPAPKRTF